jgi:hypothetical protein
VGTALKLSPYNRSYLKLLPSIGSALLVTLLVSKAAMWIKAGWPLIIVAAVLSYAAFAIVVLAMGLDADDRLVANAVWMRVRRTLGQ